MIIIEQFESMKVYKASIFRCKKGFGMNVWMDCDSLSLICSDICSCSLRWSMEI